RPGRLAPRRSGRRCSADLSSWPLECPPEGLVPGLGRGDPHHLVLVVTDVEVEVGEELELGQRVGRVDAEIGIGPGWANAVLADDLDPTPDAQPIGHTVETARGQVEVALPSELLPQLVAQRQAGHFAGPVAG